MNFETWWAGIKTGMAASVPSRQVRALCKIAWQCGEDARSANTLAAWEGMAGKDGTSPMMDVEDVQSFLRKEPPKDVEQLISFLNTRGGRCYLEHANMIRNFIRSLK